MLTMFSEIGANYELKAKRLRDTALASCIFLFIVGIIVVIAFGIETDKWEDELVIHWDVILGVIAVGFIVDIQICFAVAFAELMLQTKRSADNTSEILQLLKTQNVTESTKQPESAVAAAQTPSNMQNLVQEEQGVLGENTNKEAVAPIKDHPGWVICPQCGQRQRQGRKICFKCSVEFLPDTE